MPLVRSRSKTRCLTRRRRGAPPRRAQARGCPGRTPDRRLAGQRRARRGQILRPRIGQGGERGGGDGGGARGGGGARARERCGLGRAGGARSRATPGRSDRMVRPAARSAAVASGGRPTATRSSPGRGRCPWPRLRGGAAWRRAAGLGLPPGWRLRSAVGRGAVPPGLARGTADRGEAGAARRRARAERGRGGAARLALRGRAR